MDKKTLVKKLIRIKRSVVKTLTKRIKEEHHNQVNFIVEEEINKAYSEITKILLRWDEEES